jgi:hypothetical protein
MSRGTVIAFRPYEKVAPDAQRARSMSHVQYGPQICRLAIEIEGDVRRMWQWYREDAIAEFHDLTAQGMCELGLGAMVIAYLQQIKRGQRG